MLTLELPALNICQRTEKTYFFAGKEYEGPGAIMRDPANGSIVAPTDLGLESRWQKNIKVTSTRTRVPEPFRFEMSIAAKTTSPEELPL
jgi:hypothetical protein